MNKWSHDPEFPVCRDAFPEWDCRCTCANLLQPCNMYNEGSRLSHVHLSNFGCLKILAISCADCYKHLDFSLHLIPLHRQQSGWTHSFISQIIDVQTTWMALTVFNPLNVSHVFLWCHFLVSFCKNWDKRVVHSFLFCVFIPVFVARILWWHVNEYFESDFHVVSCLTRYLSSLPKCFEVENSMQNNVVWSLWFMKVAKGMFREFVN